MRPMQTPGALIALLVACAVWPALPARGQEVSSYSGMCDASAAVALDAEHFAVADDERNVLQIYRRGRPEPVASVKLWKFLGTKKDKESDLEGAAAIGKRVYWISSHGRNSKGEVQERRFRFFATRLKAGAPPRLAPIGRPYAGLLDDLVSAPELQAYDLAAASKLPPEAPGGLNIEGLAATPQGELLIGFRNPVPGGKALLVPLKNPKGVLKGSAPQFGTPFELALGGRGIRSIELIGDSYLIVAGPTDDGSGFAIHRWSGRPGDEPVALDINLKGLRVEALFAVPGAGEVQLLSDDGGVEIDGVECKKREQTQQSFRSLMVRP
jgi:hypothetical protein